MRVLRRGRRGHWCAGMHGDQTDLALPQGPGLGGRDGPSAQIDKAKGRFGQGGQRGLLGAGGAVWGAMHA